MIFLDMVISQVGVPKVLLDSNHKFRKQKQSYDGHVDTRLALITISGGEIMLQMDVVVNHVFGKKTINLPNRRKRGEETLTVWKKRSIFFTLPYWEDYVVSQS